VCFQGRWELDEEASFFCEEVVGGVHEFVDVDGNEGQVGYVSDAAPEFDGKAEVVGHFASPFGKGAGLWDLVETAVDFDAVEEGGVVGEAGGRLKFPGEVLFVRYWKDEAAGAEPDWGKGGGVHGRFRVDMQMDCQGLLVHLRIRCRERLRK